MTNWANFLGPAAAAVFGLWAAKVTSRDLAASLMALVRGLTAIVYSVTQMLFIQGAITLATRVKIFQAYGWWTWAAVWSLPSIVTILKAHARRGMEERIEAAVAERVRELG